uniref:LRR containing protein n=1 Tax=Panagrolaimus davidi TaxID=227884 RepID=A0A914PG11_9BILA
MDSSAIVSKPVFYAKCVWPAGPTKKQNWPFKESLIYYISTNPSSAKFYQKTIQSCKYFFEKNSVLVVSKLKACKDNANSLICSYTIDECKKNKGKCCVKIDTAKVSSKIWITDKLSVKYGSKNFTSVLCSKLYRCEIDRLEICDKLIMFDDLQLLTSSVKDITLWDNKITFNDGKPVMLDKIIESSPIVTEFVYKFGNDDSTVNASLKNIMKLENLGKIEYFGLDNLPESLSIEDISAVFKVG